MAHTPNRPSSWPKLWPQKTHIRPRGSIQIEAAIAFTPLRGRINSFTSDHDRPSSSLVVST